MPHKLLDRNRTAEFALVRNCYRTSKAAPISKIYPLLLFWFNVIFLFKQTKQTHLPPPTHPQKKKKKCSMLMGLSASAKSNDLGHPAQTAQTYQGQFFCMFKDQCLRTSIFINPSLPITRKQNFRLVQIETKCRRHFKKHLKWRKISAIYGRKHCEKMRNCLLQASSPFLTMFSTAIYLLCIKMWHSEG